MNRFVCAFRGRRDNYQVPLALAENALLERFVTDVFAGPAIKKIGTFLPGKIGAKIDFRSEPGIPAAKVKCLWTTTIREHVRHRAGCARPTTYAKLDQDFSRAAARIARRERCNLFLYSPYAWEAFTARYSHTPRKVLFQFHPHTAAEQKILVDDFQKFSFMASAHAMETGNALNEPLKRRERDCWKHADLIICASSFTKQSLVEAGAEEKRCKVIPYGIDLSKYEEKSAETDFFQALFVGTGLQRKGLHHLLLAWQKAQLPANSKLILVCRSIDRELEKLVSQTPRVELKRAVSGGELNRLFSTSTLFVMPSLVEGFGQVYLEALAQGCPVLGTANTCLPDILDETNAVSLVEPGNIEELTHKLETLSACLTGDGKVRDAARRIAARFSWPDFRARLIHSLNDEAMIYSSGNN